MPLHDHFRPPLEASRPWEGFHSAWATTIAAKLNDGLLPPEYVAIPQITVGGRVEVDVGSFEQAGVQPGNGAVATAIWAPPRPLISGSADLVPQDAYEVHVIHELGGANLRAAIELVSPRNKDRPGSKRAFARKCAAYLQRGIALVIIDVVTKRGGDFHAELTEMLRLSEDFAWRSDSGLYGISYRAVQTTEDSILEVWPESLRLDEPLPTLPLWVSEDLCLPLRLEESYLATCTLLRIA